jgi:nitroimidazol reductase NimA-like FMN-containing flavoprotein (pyridoxamine 5'-phosphate oxidase superfamily)
MSDPAELAARARAIVDANLYMALATADEEGQPWVTPVYFAHVGYRDLIWVSRPERRHSRNLAARDSVSIAIFDSSVPIGTGQAVYMTATAREVVGDELEDLVGVFARRSVEHGGGPFTAADVRAPAPLRLYRAAASEQWILDSEDNRVPVTL